MNVSAASKSAPNRAKCNYRVQPRRSLTNACAVCCVLCAMLYCSDPTFDVLVIVFGRPELGARSTQLLTELIFAAFLKQFSDGLSAQLANTRAALKFGAFDKTLRAIYSDFAVSLMTDSFARFTPLTTTTAASTTNGAATANVDSKHSTAAVAAVAAASHSPPWLYACYSPPLGASMDGGLSVLHPISTPAAGSSLSADRQSAHAVPNNGAAAPNPASLPLATGVYPFDLSKHSASGAGGSFVCCRSVPPPDPPFDPVPFISVLGPCTAFVPNKSGGADGLFPPDFTLLSEQSIPHVMRVVQAAGRLLSAPTGVRDTMRSIELGMRLPKSQSAVAGGSGGGKASPPSIDVDYKMFVIRRHHLIVAFPIRVSGVHTIHTSSSDASLGVWLSALNDDLIQLHSFLSFMDSIGISVGGGVTPAAPKPAVMEVKTAL